MNLEELSKIPISEIEKYININRRKTDCVKMRKWEDAANLRDEERIFIDKYPILSNISDYENIISKLREKKINDIFLE